MIEDKLQNLDDLKKDAGLTDQEDKELNDGVKDVQRKLKNTKKGISVLVAITYFGYYFCSCRFN